MKGKKTGGRTQGSVNKTTAELKEMIIDLISHGLPKAKEKLSQIEKPEMYLIALSKYIAFVMPKNIDVTSQGKEIRSWTVVPKNS